MDGQGTTELAQMRATVRKYRNACRCSMVFARRICGAFEHPIIGKCRDALAFDRQQTTRSATFAER